jgi:hypothetical protein
MCFLASDATARIAVEAVPLSEMMPPGRPRIATILSSSRATRMPEIDVSATSARHSRAKVFLGAGEKHAEPDARARAIKRHPPNSNGPNVKIRGNPHQIF